MCFISMVMDDYTKQRWPWNEPQVQPEFTINTISPSFYPTNVIVSNLTKEDVDRLEKLITEFKEAITIANRLDILTKKPDCIDPEKEKLIARVAELEEQLNKIKDTFEPTVKTTLFYNSAQVGICSNCTHTYFQHTKFDDHHCTARPDGNLICDCSTYMEIFNEVNTDK